METMKKKVHNGKCLFYDMWKVGKQIQFKEISQTTFLYLNITKQPHIT